MPLFPQKLTTVTVFSSAFQMKKLIKYNVFKTLQLDSSLAPKKYASITPILIKLYWLPVIARIEYKILLTVFKSLNNLAPEYISELLNQYNPPRALRSANKNLLIVPKTLNKIYGDRAFYAAAPKLWNNLPQTIRDCNSITSFKSNLKTHLFRKHYKL